MSNVLIGIIGVILFIGLALAGALFLGPRFQEATVSSKASAVVQQMKQVSDSIVMYQTNEGRLINSSDMNADAQFLVSSGYMKSDPRNPVTGHRYVGVDETGHGSATPVKFVYTDLGGDDAARKLCQAIERSAGAADPAASTASGVDWSYVISNRRAGCVRVGVNEYDAYIPV